MKKIENRSTFAEVMPKNQVYCFFRIRCRLNNVGNADRLIITVAVCLHDAYYLYVCVKMRTNGLWANASLRSDGRNSEGNLVVSCSLPDN